MNKEKTTGMRFRANRRKGSRNTGGNRTLTDSVRTRIETERVCRTRGRTNGAAEGIEDAAPGYGAKWASAYVRALRPEKVIKIKKNLHMSKKSSNFARSL